MELKKNPQADLTRFRGLFLEIGLILSLGLMIGAFTYTPSEIEEIEAPVMFFGTVEQQITEITRQEKKVVTPPKKVEVRVISDLLQVVTNDTQVEMDEIDFEEFDVSTEIVHTVSSGGETIVDDTPVLFAETMPGFMGGDINTFREWVMTRVKYPDVARNNGIAGNVVVSFVIEKNGKLSNIEVLATPDKSLSNEVIRVLNMSPMWTPARQNNQIVRLKFTLPIAFKIQ
ncbi:MAG: energy transducer TonB [Rikenellaceae bacterium]